MPKKSIKSVEISNHFLIPKHTKLSEKDKKALFEKYSLTLNKLPKILLEDPGLRNLDVKVGDVVKIVRPSKTVGKSIFYRGVVND